MQQGTRHAIKRLFGVRAPMRDGIELSADIWVPADPGPHPLILLRTVYLKSGLTTPRAQLEYAKLARFFLEQGYAFAVQDVRGRGESGGEYGYYFQEAQDGYDSVEWMAAQPWCNGRIGMIGGSYSGAVQWLAASQKPPHLTCIAPAASPGDFMNELSYVGGAFLQARLCWAYLVSGRMLQSNIRDEEWSAIFAHRPLITADEMLGRSMPLYREWLEHHTLDEYWKRLRLADEDYQRIDIPALHVTGWFDSAQTGALSHWQSMSRCSPSASDQYLIVGPWDHAQTCLGGASQVGELEFPEDSVVDLWSLHLAFFDRYLKRATPRFEQPRVDLYVTGRNAWRAFDAYPVPDATVTKLYLSSRGHANSLLGDGRLTEATPGAEPHDSYTFDPRNPAPLDPFVAGGCYGMDRRAPERRDDVLVYTGEALESPLDVIGPVHVELHAASDALDTDFTASLIDVYPDERAVALGPRVVGIIRARYRTSLEKTVLLTPGQIEKYSIGLGHIAHSFLARHRIRVEISSSAAPFYNPNQNTGNPVATDTQWRTAHQVIYHDARYPSALMLPLLPYT